MKGLGEKMVRAREVLVHRWPGLRWAEAANPATVNTAPLKQGMEETKEPRVRGYLLGSLVIWLFGLFFRSSNTFMEH